MKQQLAQNGEEKRTMKEKESRPVYSKKPRNVEWEGSPGECSFKNNYASNW